MSEDEFKEVLSKLRAFETMTWPEIERAGSHYVECSRLIKDAQVRLAELHLDDFDQLFSLRLQGKPRMWGLRIGNVFSVLWWDPEHAICPSIKK